MCFKTIKDKVIKALNLGKVQHEIRHDINTKNLLLTGDVSTDEVTTLIARSSGDEYSSSPHHADALTMVHIIKTKDWYIKFYFIEPNCVFISVHQ